METRVKLRILADAAKYDASCASSGGKREGSKTGAGSVTGEGICHSYTPDGRCVSLLKVLLTNFCIYDCRFCVNRLSSDIPRARFETRELVELFLDFYKRNYVEGLFLSSGILKSVDDTMEALIAVARSLRCDHDFQGYIHLKIVPGASTALIAEAGRYADRLSANVELPSDADLRALAPEKCLAVIEGTMKDVHARAEESRAEPRAPRFAPAGQSTQMVVGATQTPDREILDTATNLYRRHGLRRIYYSAFSPIPAADKRLPSRAPPLVREHRLYEADWLIRHYGFEARELTSAAQPNLDLERDPKLAWALRERQRFPVDVNRADRAELLRVPGLGVRNVERMLRIRRHKRLTLDDLAKLRVPLQRTKPFVVTADHLPRDVDKVDPLAADRHTRWTEPALALRGADGAAMTASNGAEGSAMSNGPAAAASAELTYETWRARAKAFLHASVPPEAAFFRGSLFAKLPPAGGALRVPKRFVELAEAVACHRDPSRWDLLYRLLYRLVRTTPHLLDIETDDDVRRAMLMRKAVDRDEHKLRAFVRFRRIETPPAASPLPEAGTFVEPASRYVSWRRPDHLVLPRAVPFFVERFANMRWSILTPDSCAHWDGELRFTPGVPREAAPEGDALEELWKDYYASIYNPARTNLKLLKQHVPVRHWQTLPELANLGQLLQEAPQRVAGTIERTVPQRSAADFVPHTGGLPVLAEAAGGCRGCELYEHATQTVFGRGPANAAIFCVGEQPGDQEDRTGEPFIGPAGQLLDRAFVDAGLAREDLYVTNAVKHFRWTPRGKQRIHQTPSARQVRACQPWLEAEIDRVRPAVILCLGRTAAQAILGPQVAIGELRGRLLSTSRAKGCIVTWHPSALLRMPEADRPGAYAELVADLRLARESGVDGPELRARG